ncbi:MAG: hypothetical protein AB7E32_02515 [Desulfovibrio sp.]
MKNQCAKCKQSIDNWDFYVVGDSGKICSSCLVEQEIPSQEYASLFKTSAIRKESALRIPDLPGLEEIRLVDLEREPLFLARDGV